MESIIGFKNLSQEKIPQMSKIPKSWGQIKQFSCQLCKGEILTWSLISLHGLWIMELSKVYILHLSMQISYNWLQVLYGKNKTKQKQHPTLII